MTSSNKTFSQDTPFMSICSEISIAPQDINPNYAKKKAVMANQSKMSEISSEKDSTSLLAFSVGETGSIMDITIMHQKENVQPKHHSPSRYENLYEIVPRTYFKESQRHFNIALDDAKKKSIQQNSINNIYSNKSNEMYSSVLHDISNQYEEIQENRNNSMINHSCITEDNLFNLTQETIHASGIESRCSMKDFYNQSSKEPKKATVNLMELLKNQTKNPNLEHKIKMRKSSFLTRKGSESIDSQKENIMYSSKMTSAKESAKTTAATIPKNYLANLSKTLVTTKNTSKTKSGYRTESESEYSESEKSRPKSTAKRNLDLAKLLKEIDGKQNFQKKRAKSVEKLHEKVEPNFLRKKSLGLNRSMQSSKIESIAISNTSTSEIEEQDLKPEEFEKVIGYFKDSINKLIEKTDQSQKEIFKLRQVKDIEKARSQLFQTKVNFLLQNYMNETYRSQLDQINKLTDAITEQTEEDFPPTSKTLDEFTQNEEIVKLEQKVFELKQKLAEKEQDRDRVKVLLTDLQKSSLSESTGSSGSNFFKTCSSSTNEIATQTSHRDPNSISQAASSVFTRSTSFPKIRGIKNAASYSTAFSSTTSTYQ